MTNRFRPSRYAQRVPRIPPVRPKRSSTSDHSRTAALPRGKVRPAIVVTGASAGLGRAIAKVAASEGEPVVLIGRSSQALAEAADEMRNVGGEPFTLTLDLLSAGAADEIEKLLREQRLWCAVLVNCAGYGVHGPTSAAQLSVLDLNIRALTDLTLRFLPHMIARGGGGVINIGSVASLIPGPYMALYYASKAFVYSFSEALWEELHHSGVVVTCVLPGPLKTAFLTSSGANRTRLFKLLPRLSADRAAQAAWRDFKAGRRLSIPGAIAKILAFAANYLPHAVSLPLLSRLQGKLRSGISRQE
jgi:short-subunit dehydrogenase